MPMTLSMTLSMAPQTLFWMAAMTVRTFLPMPPRPSRFANSEIAIGTRSASAPSTLFIALVRLPAAISAMLSTTDFTTP